MMINRFSNIIASSRFHDKAITLATFTIAFCMMFLPYRRQPVEEHRRHSVCNCGVAARAFVLGTALLLTSRRAQASLSQVLTQRKGAIRVSTAHTIVSGVNCVFLRARCLLLYCLNMTTTLLGRCFPSPRLRKAFAGYRWQIIG